MDTANYVRVSKDMLIGLTMAHLFGPLDPAILQNLKSKLEYSKLPAGQTLFRQGDPGDGMYIVVEGRLQVAMTKPGGQVLSVGQIGRGQSVGEMSVLTGQARSANVTADVETELAKMPKAAFDEMAALHPVAMKQVAQTMLKRLRRNQLANFVQELFGEMDEQALRGIEDESEWVELSGGQTLFKQGDAGTDLYIILSGRLAIAVKDAGGKEKIINELERGESVGEMALLSAEQRSATVYALRDTTLVKLSQAGFNRLLEAHPQTMMKIIRLIVHRFQQTLQGGNPAPRQAVLALVPLSESGPFEDFASRLADALGAFGRVARLSSESFSQFLQNEGIASTPYNELLHFKQIAWLDEQESTHDFVLYLTDRTLTEWTRQCLHQVDHVLMVANSGAPQKPGEIEAEMARSGKAQITALWSLILLHPANAQAPSGTRLWLANRQLYKHYHIRINSNTDMAHLARMLAGRAIGLALSGGGARGLAHIGVIRAMHELGIPIDLIGGTSIGAVIAAQCALGWDFQTMIDQNRAIASTLGDYTVPVVSLLSGEKYARLLRKFFGETEIEDLWRPMFCVSTNLTRAELATHRNGSLRQAVRASGALSGLLPPVIIDGNLHVDGALLNSLPVDVMRSECDGGKVIGVDASFPFELTEEFVFPEGLSSWAILNNRFNPLVTKKPYPDIASILQRSFDLTSVHDQRELRMRQAAELYLRPPVEKFGLFDMKAVSEIADCGYHFALGKLREWKPQANLPG